MRIRADPDLDCVLFLQYSWIRSQESKSMRIRILTTAVRLIEAQLTCFQKARNVHCIFNLLCWTPKKIRIFYFNTKGPIAWNDFGTVPVCTVLHILRCHKISYCHRVHTNILQEVEVLTITLQRKGMGKRSLRFVFSWTACRYASNFFL